VSGDKPATHPMSPPSFRVKLSTVIGTNYEKHDGFVVLHGIDTMSYPALMLSFIPENLNKSVIFIGSKVPIVMIRTDGREGRSGDHVS
jgi:L-asparaginase